MAKDPLHPTSQLVGANDLEKRVLDSVTAEIAVLDATGRIIYVNQPWRRFSDSNGGTQHSTGVGANYLEVCRRAGGEETVQARNACRGIQDVLSGCA